MVFCNYEVYIQPQMNETVYSVVFRVCGSVRVRVSRVSLVRVNVSFSLSIIVIMLYCTKLEETVTKFSVVTKFVDSRRLCV